MGSQELRLLEEKIENLLQYCNQLRTERDELAARDEEQSARLRELEEKLASMNEEREIVRSRVSGLISKIDKLGSSAGEIKASAFGHQSEVPLANE